MLEALDEVLGIRPWTVHMIMIFTLGRTDVLPVDDLGIKKGIQRAYRLREMPKKEKIELLAKNWHPALLGRVTLPLATQGFYIALLRRRTCSSSGFFTNVPKGNCRARRARRRRS